MPEKLLLTSLIEAFVNNGYHVGLIHILTQIFKEAQDDRLSRFANPILRIVQQIYTQGGEGD